MAGGRGEISLKEPRRQTEEGRKILVSDLAKETNNLIQEVPALRPLFLQESRIMTKGNRI